MNTETLDRIDIALQNEFNCKKDLFQEKEWNWMRRAYNAAQKNTKIVIEVSGGVVDNVFSTQPIGYFLVDHDNLDCEEKNFDLSPIEPDKVTEKLSTIFQERNKKSGYREDRNKRLVEILKEYDL
jgi:hypothetical protein